MYLAEIKLWNFRKYGVESNDFDICKPAVNVMLNPGLNVLIGENDSGKTSIVDAIRHLLGTQSRDWHRLEFTDFYGEGNNRSTKLRIEAIFRGFDHKEAAPFIEWLGFEEQNGQQEYVLNVRLNAERKSNKIVPNFRAGPDPGGTQMDGEARELLRVTYLKPLRDAENELTPGPRSRLAQIFSAHKLFQQRPSDREDEKHPLVTIVEKANDNVKDYFSDETADGQKIMQVISSFLVEFSAEDEYPSAEINISGSELPDILKRLGLAITNNPVGLGTLNLLYIAAELLLLQEIEDQGLRLGIIEELEAHLHPQAQLRLIDFLQKKSAKEVKGQFILTTHSTTLGASIDLRNLIICKGCKVFPMTPKFTELDQKNYDFLYRFLDATKANLFFARGIILVEGDAENIMLPILAEIIGRPLYRYGVSIVNVGSTAFLNYAKIFQRKDGQEMDVKVTIITDMDARPIEWKNKDGTSRTEDKITAKKEKKRIWAEQFNTGNTQCFISPNWTLEYEIALSPHFFKAYYQAILWAEKLSNARNGKPMKAKIKKIKTDVKLKNIEWESTFATDIRKREKIAFAIFKETLLDKKISKTITAQISAEILAKYKNKKRLQQVILNTPSLKYLINAICYVTRPL